MRDHDHISLGSDDAFGPPNVWVDDPFAQDWVLDIREVPGAEDGRLKDVRFRVVEILQVSDGLLLTILSIWFMSV